MADVAESGSNEKMDAMAALERQARAPVGFVAASTGPEGGNIRKQTTDGMDAPAVTINPDAIDMDDDDE